MTYDGNPHPFGYQYASRYPKKAADYLRSLSERDPSELDEREQRLVAGIDQALRLLKRCVICGRALKDEKQPGYPLSIGRECLGRVQSRVAS